MLKILKTAQIEKKDWRDKLNKFLLMQRNIPNATTGATPAELLFKFKPRDKLPSIRQAVEENPEVEDQDRLRKYKGQLYADSKRNASEHSFVTGQKVLVRSDPKNKLTLNFEPEPAMVVDVRGSEIEIEKNGKRYSRNSSFLRPFISSSETAEQPELTDSNPNASPASPTSTLAHSSNQSPRVEHSPASEEIPSTSSTNSPIRPRREKILPSKFKDFVLN